MKKIGLLAITLIFSLNLISQEVLFEKRNFDDREGFRDAKKELEEADELMEGFYPRYKMALPHYLKAHSFNPKSSRVNYMIGKCYLHAAEKFKALDYFQKAFELNGGKFDDIHYYLGRGYHLNMDWDNAISQYEIHKNRINAQENLKDYMDVSKKIEECRNGKKLVKKPVRVWIDNIGKNINSEYPEYGMIMTADASEMFYTSRRPTTTDGGTDMYDGGYFEDVYTSNRYRTKDWIPATNIGDPINTKGHDAAVALSPDGRKMIIYLDDKGDGNLYESVSTGDSWSKLDGLGKNINSAFHESTACYTPDGRQLYFVSNRPGNGGNEPGDRNIYIATWDFEEEEWVDIKRLPENINTKYDEDGVYAHPDGKTIYFSSKGHNSMGGYDVFKAVKNEDGTWGNPINMGYPINTPEDDVFFVVAANGRDAYMTSFRKEGFGEKDLYKVTLLGDPKEPILSGEDMLLINAKTPILTAQIQPKVEVKSRLMILKGIVRDEESQQPLKAAIELVDNETGQVIANFTSDAKSGRYLVTLPGGKNYGIAVKAEGYLFHSENFNIKDEPGYKEIEKNIDLKKIDVGKSIVLRNVFFDLNKATLRSESKVELNRLVKLLTDNGSLKIEISGYTDQQGNDAYNKDLSMRRAQSVVNYLIEHGIDSGRLTYKGYGEENPIVSIEEIRKMVSKADKEAAYQKNRRTEFKVISN